MSLYKVYIIRLKLIYKLQLQYWQLFSYNIAQILVPLQKMLRLQVFISFMLNYYWYGECYRVYLQLHDQFNFPLSSLCLQISQTGSHWHLYQWGDNTGQVKKFLSTEQSNCKSESFIYVLMSPFFLVLFPKLEYT